MLASFLTIIFFSFSVIFASRSAKVLGGQRANAARLALALVLLATWAHSFGKGLQGPSLGWFLWSGFIGFGLGDMALFGALPRIGPRLAILLTQCLAAPLAATVEWLWLGTRLQWAEVGCAALILAGVAFALAPDHGWEGSRRTFWVGALFGLGSAGGQALGAVISRKALLVAEQAGFHLDGGTAAYQRLLAGAVTTWIALAIFQRWQRAAPVEGTAPVPWRKGAPLVAGNALAGPVLGVACFQWALQTTPSGVVLPIVATSPLVTMALAFAMDGARPPRRAATGSVLAVAGAVLMKMLH